MTTLRSIVYRVLDSTRGWSLSRTMIPNTLRGRFRAWLNDESRPQWCRVVMNQEIRRFIASLDCSNIDALEISGTGSKGVYDFRSYKTVDYPAYDLCEKPLESECFDLIIAEQVLEHVRRPDLAVGNVYKMLRPGGIFVVSTPFLLKIHEAPLDLHRWTERGMRELLETAQLEVMNTGSWGNRECLLADMKPGLEWTLYDPRKHSLHNEPQFAIVVWAFARRDRAAHGQ